MDRFLDVSEAADRLALSERRIRQLARAGALPAVRIGRAWAFSAEDVAASPARVHGRPFSMENAWRIAALADGGASWPIFDVEGEPDPQADASRRWKALRSLQELIRGDDAALGPKLRRRHHPAGRYFAHPSQLDSIAGDRRVILSGVRAAADGEILADRLVDLYVRAADLLELERRYKFSRVPAADANVIARPVSDALAWRDRLAPRLFIAIDLLERADARARQAAAALLEQIRAGVAAWG